MILLRNKSLLGCLSLTLASFVSFILTVNQSVCWLLCSCHFWCIGCTFLYYFAIYFAFMSGELLKSRCQSVYLLSVCLTSLGLLVLAVVPLNIVWCSWSPVDDT